MQGCLSIIEVLDKHPSLCIALASIIATVISVFFSFLVGVSARRSEELRTRAQVAVQIGVEASKQMVELGKIADARGMKVTLLPIEAWIVSSVKLAELLMTRNLNTKAAINKLEDAIKFSRDVTKTIKANQ